MKNFSVKRKNNWLLKSGIVLVILIVVIFVLNIFISPLKNNFFKLSLPLQNIFWSAGKSSSLFLGSLFNGASLFNENCLLKEQNQKLLSQVVLLQSIEQGNKAQSTISQTCQNSGFKFVMAGVSGLDGDDILSINKGLEDGLLEGMPVVNEQNVLFGKIYRVYKNYSQVMLISNKNSIVNVKVQTIVGQDSDNNTTIIKEVDGVVKGTGGLTAYLDLIPISNEIKIEDILVTSAIDKSFPKDLLVGSIVEISKDDQKPFQQAKIDLFSDIKTADNLFVITNYKQNK
jgi:rod shape-determining protein MreC